MSDYPPEFMEALDVIGEGQLQKLCEDGDLLAVATMLDLQDYLSTERLSSSELDPVSYPISATRPEAVGAEEP